MSNCTFLASRVARPCAGQPNRLPAKIKALFQSISLLLIIFVAAPLTGQAQTIKIATIAPDGTSWMQAMRQGAAEVKKRTDGRVKLRFYPGGVMGDDKSMLRKIRIGQLQGGALSGSGLALISPDANLYGLPYLFRSYAEVDYVRQRMDDYMLQGLLEAGFIGFGLIEGGFAYLLSNTPINTVDELRGRKVWIPEDDKISLAGLQALGVAPVPLPLTDVLTGLQTGLIDTVGNSPSGAIALQWHTKVKYLTDTPLFYIYGALVVQRQAFERLSRQDQAIVREVLNGVFIKLNTQNRLDNQSARRALEKQGIRIIAVNPKQQAAWQARVVAAMDRLGQQGLFSLSGLQTLRRHLDAYRRASGG